MKSARQLAIINLLTEYKMITAPMLAERFEVSKRTINRDVDELCMAGFPIITTQGKNGGISLMEGYTIDKRILKKEELKDIIAGLKGVESVRKDHEQKHLHLRISDDESLGYVGFDRFSNSYNEAFSITLKPYQRYVAVVRGEVSAKAFLTGSGRALAHPDDNGYIGINQVKIIF